MSSKPVNLQDAILDEVCQNKISVTMFLMNGVQLRGCVIGYDNFVVVVEIDGKQQMVYKHAISTIIPNRALNSAKHTA